MSSLGMMLGTFLAKARTASKSPRLQASPVVRPLLRGSAWSVTSEAERRARSGSELCTKTWAPRL